MTNDVSAARDALRHAGGAEHPFFVGEGYSKLFEIPAGVTLGQHSHKVGHESILLLGRAVLCHGDGRETELDAPAIVYLPAYEAHAVRAITPVLWACNWPNPDGLLDADELERKVIA